MSQPLGNEMNVGNLDIIISYRHSEQKGFAFTAPVVDRKQMVLSFWLNAQCSLYVEAFCGLLRWAMGVHRGASFLNDRGKGK